MWGDQIRRLKVMRPAAETPPVGGGSGSSPVTPSLINNALTTSCDSRYAAYAHVTDVVHIDMTQAAEDKVACKLLQCQSTVMSVKICETGEGPVIVVGCIESVQVWSCTSGARLTSYTVPSPPDDDPATYDRRFYVRGAAIVARGADEPSALVVGASNGNLHVFDVEGQRFLYAQALEGHHKAPIADIASSHEADYAAHTLADAVCLAVGDEDGGITVWQSAAAGSLLPMYQMRSPGESLTSIRLRGDLVLASSLYGTITVLSIATCSVLCQIASNARAVTAIALHPAMPWVLSVAEDGYVNVWNLENIGSQEIEAITSHAIKDALLCGARFTGPQGKDIALVHYDVEALVILQGEKPPCA